MASKASGVSNPPSAIIGMKVCNQCGKTDEKVKRCVKCHIASYCGVDCQKSAWPEHKKVCSEARDMSKVTAWAGGLFKPFGQFRGFRVIAQDIRIVSYVHGFAVFLPKEVWHPLDRQVILSFPEKDDASCWIAGKEFAFLKVDLNIALLNGPDKDYVAGDVNVALDKIERQAVKNFLENKNAIAEDKLYSHEITRKLGKLCPNLNPLSRPQFERKFQYEW